MKILLVDDSKSARYALRLQLQRHGVEVETADSAESALEMLKGALPDAILMDQTMPGLNGFEALEIIRADARTAHLPVVMCTSHEDADFAEAARRKGVAAILPKSIAPETLPDLLARLRGIAAAGPRQPVAAALPERPHQAPSAPADQRLDERMERRLTGLLNPLIDELRRDLAERLLAEVR